MRRERRKNESEEEQRGTKCADASLVSAGLQDVLGMTPWRKEHPKATWQEIETAMDERINQLQAQMIQDVVQMGESEGWSQKPEVERPTCARCGKALAGRGDPPRWLQTNGGEAVKLTRTYGTCPECGVGFSLPG